MRAQDFLCMHNALVHALEGPGTKVATQQKALAQAGPLALFLGPGLRPWPLQCMHKSVVHAQECCARTRILCMHKDLDIFDMFCVENPPKSQTVRLSPKSCRNSFSGGLERHKE